MPGGRGGLLSNLLAYPFPPLPTQRCCDTSVLLSHAHMRTCGVVVVMGGGSDVVWW